MIIQTRSFLIIIRRFFSTIPARILRGAFLTFWVLEAAVHHCARAAVGSFAAFARLPVSLQPFTAKLWYLYEEQRNVTQDSFITYGELEPPAQMSGASKHVATMATPFALVSGDGSARYVLSFSVINEDDPILVRRSVSSDFVRVIVRD